VTVSDPAKRPFEQVVAEHGATVLRVCWAVLGPDEAEDAWSETFLAALKAYPGLPADANVEAWLVTIAHRKAIDAVRAAARRPLAADPVPDRPAREGLPGDRDSDLRAAVAALPDRQRMAIAYHYLAGLPYAQVAEITGGSADAARRAAADGIAALRRTYQAAVTTGEER
jgi:RNA polymerase sigma factor (sigma-70 family)